MNGMPKNSQLYGAEARKAARNKRAMLVESRTSILYEEMLSGSDEGSRLPNPQSLRRLDKLSAILIETYSARNERAIAFRYATDLAIRDYPKQKQKIKKIFDLSVYEGLRTTHDFAWWNETQLGLRLCRRWRDEFSVAYTSSQNAGPLNQIFHIAMSAVFNGAIGSDVWISAFLDMILSPRVEFILLADGDNPQYWVDLQTDSSSVPRNKRDENSEVSTRLWRIDATTLVLLLSYLRDVKNDSNKNPVDRESVLRSIEVWTQSGTTRTIRINRLCKIGVFALESRQYLPVSQPMLKTAVGGYASASIILSDFVGVTQDKVTRIDSINYEMGDERFRIDTRRQTRHIDERQSLDKEFLGSLLDIVNHSEDLLDDLNNLAKGADTSGRSVLIGWYRHLLEDRGLKTSSVATYHSVLAQRWLGACGFTRLDSCDESRINDLFDELFDDLPVSNRHHDYVLERAQDLFRYMKQIYQWDFAMPHALTQRIGAPSFIRADVIPLWVVNGAVSYLLSSGPSIELVVRRQLALILVIAHRTGMRISEILKIRLYDVENSNAMWVFVRESEFGGHKTASAKRKIPLGALLTETEMRLFEDILSYRKVLFDENNPRRVLLFSADGSATGMFDQGFVSRVISDLMSQIYGRRLVFHSLRHTALTALEVILDGRHDGFAATITGYSQQQIDFIRRRVGGSRTYDTYWQLSGFAGHINPRSTLENYLHMTPLLFYRVLAEYDRELPVDFLKKMLGVTQTLITRNSGIKADHPVLHYDAVCRILKKMIAPYVKYSVQLLRTQEPTSPIPQSITTKNRSDVLTCYWALQQIEAGRTIQQASNATYANKKSVAQWVKSAKRLLQHYNTVRGRSRLIDSNRIKSGRLVLAPGLPNTQIELSEAVEAIASFRQVYKSERELLYWGVDYVLSRVSVENTGLRFSSPDDLSRFMSLMTRYFEASRFRVTLHPLIDADPQQQLDVWQENARGALGRLGTERVKNANKFPLGRALLVLRHPDEEIRLRMASEQGLGHEEFASHTLQFIFHMLGILLPEATSA